MPNPRLVKLIIKNFRSIGSEGVHIDLNDIVVLVGPNNAGKSSILKAYETVMHDGSKKSFLSIDDFPNNNVDPENLPQVELHSIVYEERVGTHWLHRTENNELIVKEKWTWNGPGQNPIRVGYNTEINDWDTKAPFGFAAVANLRRPEPHPVLAFDNPDVQAKAIADLLMTAINEKVLGLQAEEEENEYFKLLESLKILQNKVIDESQEQIKTANEELSKLISKVFPDYIIDFELDAENNIDKSISLFKSATVNLLMGPKDGYKSSIDKQGSGARRTLLWTALKYLSESTRVSVEGRPSRPHLLLIDEPEICLHPNAIREASNVLYELPENNNWQVMATTHSPIFINFDRDNTTIIRVEKNENGVVKGTTVFRPDKIKLGDDDKENLKLLNLCDPYVAEFFFGGKVIIVEGDTEYTAFNYIKNLNQTKYNDVHIIRARGKATIVSLIKILNQFGADYSVLHDSDRPWNQEGTKRSSAWGNNPNILGEIENRPANVNVRLIASLPNFEEAYFGEEIKKDKPYNALETIRSNEAKRQIIEKLFNALIDHKSDLPPNCSEWNSIDELHNTLAAIIVLPPFIGN
ncbi:ATP-dependent nuclease [Flavobacterium panacagri]|uniref:ATP-dependent nuclease n=1 Tax=Flavobacterium panacagri TaxID=3034146 RepID=UPI0025A5CCB9|nr:AAA family ATPase [Flavobacterium panacagri]